jgi:hypothetical protein
MSFYRARLLFLCVSEGSSSIRPILFVFHAVAFRKSFRKKKKIRLGRKSPPRGGFILLFKKEENPETGRLLGGINRLQGAL